MGTGRQASIGGEGGVSMGRPSTRKIQDTELVISTEKALGLMGPSALLGAESSSCTRTEMRAEATPEARFLGAGLSRRVQSGE